MRRNSIYLLSTATALLAASAWLTLTPGRSGLPLPRSGTPPRAPAPAPAEPRGFAVATDPFPLPFDIADLGDIPGYDFLEPVALNDRGEVIGRAVAGVNGRVTRVGGFFYRAGRLSALTDRPGVYPIAVNNRGQVAGFVAVSSATGASGGSPTRWFLWEAGRMRDLGIPGTVAGVNDHGRIVGNVGGSVVVWQNGVRKVLGVGTAFAINNRGQVIGHVRDLSPPPPLVPQTAGRAGRGRDVSPSKVYPALWDESGKCRRLATGVQEDQVCAINDRGDLVLARSFVDPEAEARAVARMKVFVDETGKKVYYDELPLPEVTSVRLWVEPA
jgi:hypothetical protein